MRVWCPWRSEEGLNSLELELGMILRTLWVLRIKSGPLEEQVSKLLSHLPALEVPLHIHDPDSIYTSLSGLVAQMSA